MSPRLLRTLRTSSLVLRIALSLAVFAALFVVSWLIYMPVSALLFAPFSLLVTLLLGHPPSPEANSLSAVVIAGLLAAATVAAVFRALLARARARRRGYEPSFSAIARSTGS
jgi:hypothetical protein